MKFIYFFIYNFIFIPPFFLLVHFAGIFNKKLRTAVVGRYLIYFRLRKLKLKKNNQPNIVVHCASMGEFEHIKPFLIQLKKSKPGHFIIVLFFSPSGYRNIATFHAVDCFLYAPYDWILPVCRFMLYVKPSLWIIAKHDVWPNQVWLAKKLEIPIFLINATLHDQSTRLSWFSLHFYKTVYSNFSKILTISSNDRQNFKRLSTSSNIEITGDTKYDQVAFRKAESEKVEIIPKSVLNDKWVLVCGSTWPQDQVHLVPAVKNLLAKYRNLFVIFCPHEPTAFHLDKLKNDLPPQKQVFLGNIKNYTGERIVVVDRIGVLANLYSLAKAAYVGGSFYQNVHNVLEAAVYGIPVLMGPVNLNSNEAQLLKAESGGFEVRSAQEIETTLEKFILNDIFRRETGERAMKVVQKNQGATRRTVETILSYLD